jgi:hypothetical protein
MCTNLNEHETNVNRNNANEHMRAYDILNIPYILYYHNVRVCKLYTC